MKTNIKGVTDRQRNEIKAYDKSLTATLAFKGDTLQYSWKFKVSSELELSSKFSHFFQIKRVTMILMATMTCLLLRSLARTKIVQVISCKYVIVQALMLKATIAGLTKL
jgi:hypothetical protein